jgi:hypothetical protein
VRQEVLGACTRVVGDSDSDRCCTTSGATSVLDKPCTCVAHASCAPWLPTLCHSLECLRFACFQPTRQLSPRLPCWLLATCSVQLTAVVPTQHHAVGVKSCLTHQTHHTHHQFSLKDGVPSHPAVTGRHRGLSGNRAPQRLVQRQVSFCEEPGAGE